MNKKCFVKEASVLLVLALMLLSVGAMAVNTGPQTSSTSAKAVATTDDLPDLTIEFVINYKIGDTYYYQTWIHNEGTGIVPAGTYILVKYFSTPEENIVLYHKLPVPLNPGDSRYNQGTFWAGAFSGDVVTAFVDPPYYEGYEHPEFNPDPVYGLVKESNEDNNIATSTIPNAKSYNLFNPLFSSLSSQTQSSSSQQSQSSQTQQSALQISQLLITHITNQQIIAN